MSTEELNQQETNEIEISSENLTEENNPAEVPNELMEITSEQDTEKTPVEPVINEEIIPETVSEQVSQSTPEQSVSETIVETSAESNFETSPETPSEQEIQRIKAEENKKAEAEAKAKEKELQAQKVEETFKKLHEIHANSGSIDVKVKSRIRGGLRVIFEDMQLFLPTSHFSMRRNPPEDELQKAVGKIVRVRIHELQIDDQGRKTVIVSRKKMLEEEFWNNLKPGDIVEGIVASVANFGVFVDIGGVEGLIHISRLSQTHIDDPRNTFKKGQPIKCVVVEADKQRNRVALSRKELEESPWKNIEESFAPGSIHKGIIRRLTDFGAYIELKPGVDGLLRNPELSWTKRIKSPSELLAPGQEIEVYILSVSEEKQNINLSLKQTIPNPWLELKDKYPIGTEHKGIVSQIMAQGAIVTIDSTIDGFMPRSKIRNLPKGSKIPFQIGENVDVIINDINPEEESLILEHKSEDNPAETDHSTRKQAPKKEKPPQEKSSEESGSFTLLDILSDEDKDSLIDTVS